MPLAAPDRSDSELVRSPTFLAALGLLAAMSATSIDIVLPTTPALEQSFGVGAEDAQLVITAYVAGMSLGLIPIGMLGDRFGRRPVIMVCVSIFVLAGALTLAPLSFTALLVLRFVQGISGAVGPSLSRAIVRDLGGQNSGAQLMAVITAILSLAPLIGPLVGGALTEILGWQAPFFSSAIIGLTTLLAILAWLPETRPHTPQENAAEPLGKTLKSVIASPGAMTAIALFALPFPGYFAILTSLSAVMHDMYSVPAAHFGILFALAATAYFMGALLARSLLTRVADQQVLKIGMTVLCVSGLMYLGTLLSVSPPSWLLWLDASSYMFGMAVCLPVTSMAALGPLARAAGLGAAILGMFQIGIGSIGSVISARFYDGTHLSLCAVAAFSALAASLICVLRFETLTTASVQS